MNSSRLISDETANPELDVEIGRSAPTTLRRSNGMKYILMMSATKPMFDWYAAWPKQDLDAHFAFMRAFSKELKDSGKMVATSGLAFPNKAKLVRAGDDGEPVTDGVFPEAKEFLAGYWIVEVASEDEACRIAARASLAPGPGGKPSQLPIEVRQVLNGPPDELTR
jgi:hypothetical protein